MLREDGTILRIRILSTIVPGVPMHYILPLSELFLQLKRTPLY